MLFKVYFLLSLILFSGSLVSAQDFAYEPFSRDGKWGFKDREGKVVLPATLDSEPSILQCGEDDKTMFVIISKNKLEGLLDASLKELLPPVYTKVSTLGDGVTCYCCMAAFRVKKNEQWAIYNPSVGKFLTDFIYSNIELANYTTPFVVVSKHDPASDKTLQGVISIGDEAKVIIPVTHETIYYSGGSYYQTWLMEDKFFMLANDKRIGLYDTTGSEIFPLAYEDIELNGDHQFIILKKGAANFQVADWSGKLVKDNLDTVYVTGSLDDDPTHLVFGENGKLGVLGSKLDELFPAEYDSLEIDGYGRWVRAKKDGEWALYQDGKTRYVIDYVADAEEYKVFYDSVQQLVAVRQGESWGLLGSDGQWKIKPVYTSLEIVKAPQDDYYGNSGRYLLGQTEEEQSLISMRGDILASKPNMDIVKYRNLWKVTYQGSKGDEYFTEEALLDWNGNMLVPFFEGEILLFEGDKAVIRTNERPYKKKGEEYVIHDYYVLNHEYNRINTKPYAFTGRPGDSMVRVNRGGWLNCSSSVNGGQWGFMDLSGKLVIPARYTYAKDFNDGLALVYEGGYYMDGADEGQWRLINKKGEDVVPLNYSVVYDYSPRSNYGFYKIAPTDEEAYYKVGLLNATGKEVLPPTFDYIGEFIAGHAVVSTSNGAYGLIDSTARFVFDTLYTQIEPFTYPHPDYANLYIMQQDSLKGLYTLGGKEILPPLYGDISRFKDDRGFVELEHGGRVGIFSLVENRWILRPAFDKISDPGEEYFFFTSDSIAGVADYSGDVLTRTKKDYRFYHGVFYGSDYGDSCKANNAFPVMLNYKLHGVIDSAGNEFVPVIYDKLDLVFNEHAPLIIAQKDDLEYAFDLTGKNLFPEGLEDVSCYGGDELENFWFFFEGNGKKGWVDLSGRMHEMSE